MKLSVSSRPVLVTGASGFLGEHLALFLADRGCRVAGTFSSNPAVLPRIDLVPLHLNDAGAVRRLVRDMRPAAVFHTASWTDAGQCEREPAEAESVIVGGTGALAAAAAEFCPESPFVFLSTDLVFDGTRAPYRVRDSAKPLSRYGGLKLRAEDAVRCLPAGIVVRAALMTGRPASRRGGFLAWMRQTLAEGRPLDLFEDEWRTPVYVPDLCEALVALAGARAAGTWHASGPERLSRLHMGQAVCEVFGYDSGLLRARRLTESTFPAPRPADVSMVSAETWQVANHVPRAFRAALEEIRRHESAPDRF